MLTNVKDILAKADDEQYAVGAFNVVNLETVQAVVHAAQEKNSPVIIQVTETTMNYTGGRAIFNLIKNIAEFYAPEIPIGVHLDHGKNFEIIQRAVEIGFTSVMYDGSRKKYEDNLAMTKKIVDFCHERGVVVQAELGSVPYIGETQSAYVDWEKYMTDPSQAESFIDQSGADTLAVAIGNAHGFFKERETPDYERLEEISQNLKIPLILHGASDWEQDKVSEVVNRGVTCFNVDTALRMAFINQLINLAENKSDLVFDIRKILGASREAVKEVVKVKMEIFKSAGKI